MSEQLKYKYHYRPEYGSDKLLIEFVSGVETKNFGRDLFDALNEINPKPVGMEDLWMNDEIIYIMSSNLGQFTLSKDIYDLAFLMAEDNQYCLVQINNLLINDERFEKIDVDFNNYKTEKNTYS